MGGVQSLGFRVQGSEFRVQGLKFRVRGFWGWMLEAGRRGGKNQEKREKKKEERGKIKVGRWKLDDGGFDSRFRVQS